MIKTIVHKINIYDCELDPDISVASEIYEWEQSESGKFVMENSIDKPIWHRSMDSFFQGYVYEIVAYFDEKTHTYWNLKYK